MKRVGPWTCLQAIPVYENPWIAVEHHRVLNPRGNPGIYGVVRFKNFFVGVVPVDEEGYTWIVGQHRYPLDLWSWEIPEGGCPSGETPLAAAQRELAEETGLTAGSWVSLGMLHTSNSVCAEAGEVFLARDLSRGSAHPEDCEVLQVRRLPFAEALAMALDGRITDCISVVGLCRAARWMGIAYGETR